MLGLNLSPRRALVIAHDLLMTAAAIVASFYIRFEAVGLADRRDPLLFFLPGFVAYAGDHLLFVPSVRSEVALCLASGLDEHPACVDGAGRFASGARLCPGGAQRARAVLFRQDHDRAVLDPAERIPRRPAHRLSLFPLHPHAPSRAGRGGQSDACARPRGRRRGPAARHRERRRAQDLAGRCAVAIGVRSAVSRYAAFRFLAALPISTAWSAISRSAAPSYRA